MTGKERITKRKIFAYIFLAAAIAVSIGLCVGSLMPAEKSAAVSNDFAQNVGNAMDNIGIEKPAEVAENDDAWHFFVRKLFGHYGAFMGLGVLVAVALILFCKPDWRSRLLVTVAGVVYGFTFACFTEFLQTDLFTTGRGPSFDDVIRDCEGYMTAMLIFAAWLAVMLVRDIVKRVRYGRLLGEEGYNRVAALPAVAADKDGETEG